MPEIETSSAERLGADPCQTTREFKDDTMTTTPETAAFERGVGPILQMVLLDKADTVLSFRADAELQERIEELAAKSTEGDLTTEERSEYKGYVRANKFIAILQRQARRILRIEQ